MERGEKIVTYISSSKEQQKQGCSMMGDEAGAMGDPDSILTHHNTVSQGLSWTNKAMCCKQVHWQTPDMSGDESSPGVIQGAPEPWDSASQRQQGTGLKIIIKITLTKK